MRKIISLITVLAMCLSIGSVNVFADECNHNWILEDSMEASCDSEGFENYYCDLCYAEKTETIKKTAHVWDSWEVVKKATVFRKGKKERCCFNCYYTQSKSTKKLKAYVKFKKKTYKVKAGKSLKLKSRIKYARGDKPTKWKSSNRSIATVNKAGKLKAKKSGRVKITVKMKSGKKATCKIKVKPKKSRRSSKASKKKSGGGTVYWVASGDVYHSTKSCSTLSRSKTIYSGPLSKCPKSRPCKRCH